MRIDKTRLRWTKTKEGIIKSEKLILGSEVVQVFIDPTNYPFVFEVKGGSICYIYGTSNTIRGAKSAAKAKLKSCNAKFYDEIRKKVS